MRKVLYIFGQLTDADISILARFGKRRSLPIGTVLIHEGVPVETLYIVLEGALAVILARTGRELARLTVGDLAGEMSFIDARPPSATVCAATDVVVCAISKTRLESELFANVGFASRFYKAVAIFLSDRLRAASAGQSGTPAAPVDELDDNVLDSVGRAGERFDQLSRQLLDDVATSPLPSRR